MGKRGILFLFLLLLFNLCFVSATTINGNIQRVEQDGTSLFEGISVEIKLSDNSTYETSSDKEGNFLFNINKPEESLSQIKLLYNGCLLFESNPSSNLEEDMNLLFTINSLNTCQESSVKTIRTLSTSSLSSQANQYPNYLLYRSSDSSKIPVLLIHGWDNKATVKEESWGGLEDEIAKVGIYNIWKLQYYPGNLSNKKNAGVISQAIDTVLFYHPSYNKVHVVSHSMGGLGTRGYIQNLGVDVNKNPVYYKNNIDKYVIMGSPTYGSYFANMIDSIDKYQLINEHPLCAEFVTERDLEGGTEATADLEIGSNFTWELNNQNINTNIDYLVISGSRTADRVPLMEILYRNKLYCLSNHKEINDGVVSLIDTNLLKYNIPLINLDKFHSGIGFLDLGEIKKDEVAGEIIVLFLIGNLNEYTVENKLNQNSRINEFYYNWGETPIHILPTELNKRGSIILQIRTSEININEIVGVSLYGQDSATTSNRYVLEKNTNTGRWFYSEVNHRTDEFINFTTSLPINYIIGDGYEIHAERNGKLYTIGKIDILPGQVKLVDLNLDKDNDKYDQTSIGGTDCNDNNNAIHPRAIEKCNNIDDNCNGFIDEGFDKGVLCSAGIGECKVDGVKVCSGDGSTTVCNAVPKSPIEEICFDGLDNDCDGEIDEECNSCVLLFTSMGNITLELYEDMPLTTLNFKILTSDKFYDNTIFHRVIEDFMIQGGDPTGTGMGGPGYVILDEFTHAGGNKNNRGTISMANAGPNTGGSQFFINLVDNNYLDEKNPVFGEVVKGMEVVDAISTVEVNEYDKPINDVIIIKASLTKCCIPNFVNSSWSSWSNISCLSNNKMNQSRFKIQYDFNFCGKFENKTFYEYRNTQNCKYNTCTPQLTNTTWNSWKNESCLTNINKMNQSRYLTQYDSNFCRINLSDVYVGFVPSDLASRVSLDQTEDEYKFEIDYYGEEITADVYVLGGGGESFKLDKSTNHINFNEGLNSIYNSLDDSEMPLFLASGIYLGEEYIQEITLSDNVLTLFADKDYKDQEPAIGFKWNNGENILSYEIEFDNTIPFNSLIGTYLPLMDNKYYVQSANSSQIILSMPGMNISIKNNEEIELNGTDIDGLYATFTNYGIKLFWNSNGDTFLTQENSITIPLFETISLVFENFNFPEYSERISLEDGETMMLNMDNYELPILWFDGVSAFLGEEGYPLITKTSVLTSKYYSGSQNTTPLTGGLDLREDDRFLITSLDNDLSDIETLYYEVVYILWDGEEILVELNDLIGSNDLTFDDLNDEKDVGDITLSLAQVNNTNVYLKFNSISGTISYNNVISDKGMKITLPEKTDTQPNDVETGVKITFQEANKEGDVGEGKSFTATIKSNINDKLHVTNTNVTLLEILSNRLIISNKTFYEYRQVQNCTDYTCISQLKNTSWSNWQNISCVSNNKMNQSRFRIQYDFNFCGKVENKTFYEYQSIKNCNDLVVISPDKEIYSKTSILFNINSTKPNYKLSKLVYSDNGKTPVTLCSNCYGYSRARTLTNGYHDILFKGITPEGDTITNSVQLLIDSKLPVISSVKPTSSKYTNGSDFYVKYSEDNCKELILMINEGDIRSGSCDSGKYIEKYLSEDLSKYDGEIVSYKFKIIDIADNVKESRTTKIKVDTTAPEIKDLKIEKSGRYAVFNMTILNEDKYSFNKVEYIDNSALKPTWKSLCTSLSYGKYCYKKIYFQSGNHDITVRVSDDAGNSDKENKIVKI